MTILEMAADYRESGIMIHLRIRALQKAQQEAGHTEWILLERRIRALAAVYGDIVSIVHVLEHGRYQEEEERIGKDHTELWHQKQ